MTPSSHHGRRLLLSLVRHPLYKLTSPPLLTQLSMRGDRRVHVELSIFCLLLANILQATIAIRSPPAPYPPLSSPAKSRSPATSPRPKDGQQHRTMTPPTWRGKSGGLSPNVRFSFPVSLTQSLTRSSLHAPNVKYKYICR